MKCRNRERIEHRCGAVLVPDGLEPGHALIERSARGRIVALVDRYLTQGRERASDTALVAQRLPDRLALLTVGARRMIVGLVVGQAAGAEQNVGPHRAAGCGRWPCGWQR